ncbi:pseudouridine synthase [Thauera sp. 2A1]|uniref:pseudouridine synthase n=1 Tax=Thauera sp. 2A1 TaxID=2570191 RepID=UPI001D1738C5|nr:pseudouridine synthase [Thauera sp. 2A1]KAI5916264.1 pseudouridine synthase [Thauera sp. 2A1]
MVSIRKNPPQPAPSRIAGTLKVKKREPDPVVDEAAAEAPRQSARRASETDQPARGRTADRAAKPARQGEGKGQARGAAKTEAGGGKMAGPKAGPNAAGASGRRTSAARAPARDEGSRAHAPAPISSTSAEGVRLSKVMADRGICSRREADELIARGWVFVDGKRVSELGTRIDPAAGITLAPEARREQAQRVTILLHKPVGYVSGQPEPGFEPAVSLIGAHNQFDRDTAQRFHPSQLKNLAPAGRLDIDSTGLLVLTQDGRVARQLIGEDSEIDKEYLVRVEGTLVRDGLELLNHGLELDGRKLRPAQVEWLNDDQLRFVLREGRKRQIRRMCELVGLRVTGLKRVRIGRVRLGDLPLGQWRYLREDEAF